MRACLCLALIVSWTCCFSVGVFAADSDQTIEVSSPGNQIKVKVELDEGGQPGFAATFGDVGVVTGTLGLEFAEAGALSENLEVTGVRRNSHDEIHSISIGKCSSVRDHHNEVTVSLKETKAPHRQLDIVLRVFEDGIAFRYAIPKQAAIGGFVLTDEHTRLTFADNPQAKCLPLASFTTPYEAYYETKPLSELKPDRLVGLPLLLTHPKKISIAVTEADLTDYAGMYLSPVAGERGVLAAKLSPLPGRKDGGKVIGQAPHASPWRVIMIADDPGRLLESNIVFQLNPPSRIKDTSWIKPGKTTFPWWNHYVLDGVDFKPGVNTATMKYYIDFCAEHGIPYHSLDGLDIAWYGGPIAPAGPTDVTKAAASIDLPEVLRYAKEKGIRLRLWMHWKALKPQLDEAFRTYEKWGIEGVMIDFMDRDDQEMIRWYHEVAEKAAKHRLTVTWHGACKPTGMERTWPNVLSYEAALNQEYNKWQPPGVKGTPPEHNLDVAFVRMLAGPLDYHQGGMRNVLPEDYRFRDVAPPVQGTRGHQLAMYVVYHNHLPMMADSPTAYRGQPGLDFLTRVPSTWDEMRVVHAELSECLVVARRKGSDWYLGGMTAGKEQVLSLPLKFLGKGKFKAELYVDDLRGGPTAVTHAVKSVSGDEKLPIAMPRSGGFVARITKERP